MKKLLQVRGCATGTKFAFPYAILFMADLDLRYGGGT